MVTTTTLLLDLDNEKNNLGEQVIYPNEFYIVHE